MFDASARLLVAVSGGIDSVVLCHLLHQAGYTFDMAHCNFNLRPGDCDRDERFVAEIAKSYNVRLHTAHFDTQKEARQLHTSIEETARQQRYSFFAAMCDKHGYDCLVTGHHRDDAAETFFLNLLRGTGIGGLHGILPKQQLVFGHLTLSVARPLLTLSRNDIVRYAHQNQLQHVEDYTNNDTQYRRNAIRHKVLPLLRDISASADDAIAKTIAHLHDTEIVYHKHIEQVKQQIVHSTNRSGVFEIAVNDLAKLEPQRTLTYEIIKEWGFNPTDTDNLIASLDGQAGRQFLSASHRIIKDRSHIVVEPLAVTAQKKVSLLEDLFVMEHIVIEPGSLTPNELKQPKVIAQFDADRLVQPLYARHWRQGDRFHPFGMKGTRLVSDLLSDNKISLERKADVLVLCDGKDRILWVVGLRTAEIAPITDTTTHILRLVLKR